MPLKTLRNLEVSSALAIAVLALACQQLSGAESLPLAEPFANAEATEAILEALPPEWSLRERRENELPWGHFKEGHGGDLLVLVGPKPIHFLWRSGDEPWHREAIARESLELWLLPAGYAPAPRPAGEHHPPVPAVEVFVGESLAVYGKVSHVITAREKFDTLMRQAPSTSWSDIPRKSLSWASWRQDLRNALRVYERAEP